jgi:hypothetical protein
VKEAFPSHGHQGYDGSDDVRPGAAFLKLLMIDRDAPLATYRDIDATIM